MGWYFMTDILYVSEIHPLEKIKNITDYELEKIRKETYKISQKSYKMGGLTIKDYISPTRKSGMYQTLIYQKRLIHLEMLYNVSKKEKEQ